MERKEPHYHQTFDSLIHLVQREQFPPDAEEKLK